VTAVAVTLRSRPRLPRWLARTLAFGAIFAALALVWEGYKVLGKASDGLIPFTDVRLPVRPDDTSMPHIFDVFAALFRPVSRARDADLLVWLLIKNAAITWHRAAIGFLMGSLAGFGLGALFARSRLLERGLMPFVVASQTIPLIAIAPMIVIWGGSGAWPPWLVSAFGLDDAGFSVAIISAYLTFFPVTINSLRGLRSRGARSLDDVVSELQACCARGVRAWTADALGDPTARYLGRVSLNPMVHADLFGTIIFPLVGFFTGFMFYAAAQMFVEIKPRAARHLPGRAGLVAAGAGIGGLSTLLAAGGAFLSIPFLAWCNVPLKRAIGTAAANGFPIALAGTVGYVAQGLRVPGLPEGSVGYVYLPALLLIVAASMPMAPLGARLAHRLPVRRLRVVLALMLLALALRMLANLC